MVPSSRHFNELRVNVIGDYGVNFLLFCDNGFFIVPQVRAHSVHVGEHFRHSKSTDSKEKINFLFAVITGK